MNFVARFSLCLCLVGSSLANETWVVREDGAGPVKIGMSLSQLNAVLHEKFSTPAANGEQGCFYVDSSKHPHILFMIIDGRLARIDVLKPGVSTPEGVQVGDTESHARKVYGSKLKAEPHAYTGPEGHYLTAHSKDGRFGVRFETDDGKITMFYAGRYKAIQYVEG
jgi:hypothetical protein